MAMVSQGLVATPGRSARKAELRAELVEKALAAALDLNVEEKSALVGRLHQAIAAVETIPSGVVIQATGLVAGAVKTRLVVLESVAPSLVTETVALLAQFASLALWEQIHAALAAAEKAGEFAPAL